MRSDGDEDEKAMFIRKCRCCEWKNVWRYVGSPLPIKDWREELGNETLIVWAEGLSVNRIVALAV